MNKADYILINIYKFKSQIYWYVQIIQFKTIVHFLLTFFLFIPLFVVGLSTFCCKG